MQSGENRPSNNLYIVNPRLRIEALDSRSSVETYQLILINRRFRVNKNCLDVIEFFTKPHTLQQFDEWFLHHWRNHRPIDEFEATKDSLIRLGIIVPSDCSIRDAEVSQKKVLSFQTELWKSASLDPITDRLTCLFRRKVWPYIVSVSSAILLISLSLLALEREAVTSHQANWWMIIVVVYSSLLFHEIGHLTACKYFGQKHGGIGWGIMFIYPVFYADVSNCWSLTRYRRAVVDIAGVYFQFIFGAGIASLGVLTQSMLLQVGVTAILFSIGVNLNPFFRLDGYWFINDISGVTSIEKLRNHLVNYYWHRLVDKDPPIEIPEVFKQPRWVFGIVVVYTGICCLFILHLIDLVYRGIPRVITLAILRFTALFNSLQSASFTEIMNLIAGIAFVAIAFASLGRLVYRLVRRLVLPVMQNSRSRHTKQILRNSSPSAAPSRSVKQ